MKCLELKPRRSIIKTDHRFMAKIPLLPSKYIWERNGESLGLLASDKRNTLLIITDNEDWLNRYRKFYQERFDVVEHDDDFSVDADFETIFGKVQFDSEVLVDEEDDEADEELASELESVDDDID